MHMSEDAQSEVRVCPQCGTEMNARPLGSGHLWSCPDGHGVFLARMDLGSLVESETDWHRLASQGTMPIPRITTDMGEGGAGYGFALAMTPLGQPTNYTNPDSAG